MIKELVLTNFKKHTDRTFNFSAGLTALKGNNEQGKSSVYHAILYAYFGARALPLTLAETVTYDQPEASLKVGLTGVHEGVAYRIVRSKSGAKMTHGDVVVSGQAEVTRYVERMFGVDADAAAKLMVASQGKLRGALESNDAVALIEKLANISLIDELITKIQDQLPSGNTKVLVEAVAQLAELPAPTLDLSDLAPALAFHEAAVGLASQEVAAAQTVVQGYNVESLSAQLLAATKKATEYQGLQATVAKLTAETATPPENNLRDVAGLRALQYEQNQILQAVKVYRDFLKLPQQAPITNPPTNLEAFVTQLKGYKEDFTAKVAALDVQIAKKSAMAITDKECGLCGKLLQDVPEVVAKNSEVNEAVRVLQEHRELSQILLATAKEDLAKYEPMLVADRKLRVQAEAFKDVAELVETVPCTLRWTAAIPVEGPSVDYASQIKAAEAHNTEVQRTLTVYREALRRLSDAKEQLNDFEVATTETAELQAQLQAATEAREKLAVCQHRLRLAESEYARAEHAIALAQRAFEIESENYRASMDRKTSIEAELVEYHKNNALIKKLREARPIVASRLWAVVLASVSNHFGAIRGTPSRVTRDATTFLVDGKPAAGLSGSTLDALGLAIRIALGKTFLPSIDFLLLDEPSAGMDDNREAAMLGLLVSVNYSQVIVVTHSELADTFAANIVQG